MKLKLISLAILAAGASTTALANGFALDEQSVSALGTSNAGRASNAQDASVVYNNPAAMSFFKDAEFTAAMSFIDASTDIRNASGGLNNATGGATPGTNNGDPVPKTWVPAGYWMSGAHNGWAFGVGLYGSQGFKTNYESSFAGGLGGLKSSLAVTTLQPVLSYKITDRWSVAAGPTINRLDAVLTQGTGAPGTTAQLSGRDFGYGYTLATYLRPTDSTTVGLVYRSKVTYKVNGFLNIAGPAATPVATALGLPANSNPAQTSATMPESLELGITQKLTQRTALQLTAAWTRWSRLKSLDIYTYGVLANSQQFGWKDSMAYAVGLTHQLTDKLQLRTGVAFDNTPVNPAFASPRVPTGDRIVTSAGFGYRFNPKQSVDFSYSYAKEQKEHIVAPAAYNADFYNHANVVALQFNQKF